MQYSTYKLNARHATKRLVNERWFRPWRGYLARNAVILPSVTAQDVEICRGHRIFDEFTRFVIYENRLSGWEGFERPLKARFASIFGQERVLSSFCDLRMMNIKDDFGFGLSGKPSHDFANYDTCNFYYDIGKWLPGHIGAFRKGSPMFFTFDADYNGRMQSGMNGFPECSGEDLEMVRKGMDYFMGLYNERIIERTQRNAARLLAYIRSMGIQVRGAEIYKEPAEQSKAMVFVSGVKR